MGIVRDRLANLSRDHSVRFQQMELQARKLLEYSQGGKHLTFTPHGISHISQVEQAYDYLLSVDDIETMNPAELYCLLCATYFHDLLMIPRVPGDEAAARERHAEDAGAFLVRNKDLLSISAHEAFVVGEIVRGHHVWNLADIPEDHVLGQHLVEIRKLAACLSLADICHADESRAPQIVFQHLRFDSESAYHWRRHMMISGITRKSDKLAMSAIAFSDEGASAVEDYATAIRKQLQVCKPYFHSVLSPIVDVDCRISRRGSELDQDLRFRTHTQSILHLLVEGVYQRDDVFVRELIQNGLDACYVESARKLRQGQRHTGRVLVTELRDINKNLVAIRVDDNGVGMSLADVQDTLLWIGQTSADRPAVKELLAQTTKKELIATFGIGLLSCFKVAQSIEVRTCKAGSQPLELTISGLSDPINVKPSTDETHGTTILVYIAPSFGSLDIAAAVKHYCRMISLVDLRTLQLEYSSDLANRRRDDFIHLSLTQGNAVPQVVPPSKILTAAIEGDDFAGWIQVPPDKVKVLAEAPGTITIMSDGIFICDEPSASWLPSYMTMFGGVINLAAKAVDLPVSRDKLVENTRLQEKRKQVAALAERMISNIAKATSDSSATERTRLALLLTLMWKTGPESDRDRMLSHLDEYTVSTYDGTKQTLSAIRQSARTVTIHYEQGSWVDEIGTFNGETLYNNKDDISALQAAISFDRGYIVIKAVREDLKLKKVASIVESELLMAYFNKHNITTIDLLTSHHIRGSLRSKPIAREGRDLIGSHVKFVEIFALPKKYGWKLGEELWINTANPQMEILYNRLQAGDMSSEEIMAAQVIVKLMSYSFDDAVHHCIRTLS